MGRIASLMLAISVALSSVHSTQVSVNFVLEDSTAVSDTVPRGAFATLENQGKYSEIMQKSLHAYEAQENPGCVTMFLPGLPDKEAYACFKSLWSNPAPLHPMHITAEEFQDFVLAANYLDIRGKHAKRFARNMAKYGLLGRHSADIVSSKALYTYDLPQKIFWGLLYGFLRQTGFEYRLTHPTTGQTVLRIEKPDAWPKKINEEYTGPSQATKMRTVLHSELGPTESLETKRNEAVLVWLLLNIGGSSVDIQYTIDISSSEDCTNLTQVIEQFTEENEKGTCVHVEGLTLIVGCRNSTSLGLALQLVPHLSRLNLSIDRDYRISKATPSSLIRDISSCRSLKALEITRYILTSAEVSSLAESLLNIEQLSLWCNRLERTAIGSLKKCPQLEKLEMDGEIQLSTVVEEIVRHLPYLRELDIKCKPLGTAEVEAFQACTQLEKLKINGYGFYCQRCAVVQALLRHLPPLKELSIECEPLGLAAAEVFQACTQLERLEINGYNNQSSTTVQAIVAHLPFLRELSIRCKALDPAAAEAFQACTQLENLSMFGVPQPSSAVQALVAHLPSLKYLKIEIDTAYLALADALRKSFKVCLWS
ncbi:hypothetical protein NECID01_0636 [Nematocida sp. AWRm77]|nr:hypothetical protein NECID01_0636 [Nematocida sp. AWRm77]